MGGKHGPSSGGGNEKVDANLLLQTWTAGEKPLEAQRDRVQAVLTLAQPYIVALAEQVNDLEGAGRDEGVRRVVGLAKRMDEFSQDFYGERIARTLGLSWRQFSRVLRKKNGKGKDEEESEGEPIEYVGGWLQGHLVELIYDPGSLRTRFVVRFPDGHIEERERIELEGKRYVSKYPNTIIMRNAVMLPSEYSPGHTEAELVAVIRAQIHKYLEVDGFYENLATYYVLFTWLYDAFEVLPYLRALGDYGTGKTRLLQVVGGLCYRPIFTGGASTTSPIFRILDQYHGTLVLDEADFQRSDEAADIIKILNTGYMKGMPVLRSVDRGTAGFDVEAFDVYGPKLLASRKKFKDPAMESRCLTKEMGAGMTRMDVPIVLPKIFWKEAAEIRNMLLGYRMKVAVPERDVDYNDVDRAIENRLNQVTMALKTIVSDAALKHEVDLFVAEYNRQMVVERSTTMTARVLEAIAWLGPMEHEQAGTRIQIVWLKWLTATVNRLIDEQNRAMGDDYSTEDLTPRPPSPEGKGEKKEGGGITIKSRKIGEIVRKFLQLKTDRATSGPEKLKGTYFVHWDDARIRALGARYGVEVPTSWEKREDPFAEDREKWKQTGMEEGT